MKKILLKKYSCIPLYAMLIVLTIGIIGLIVGSFYDLQISTAIVNTNSIVGGFVETLGETLAYAMIPIGGTLAFLGLYKRPKTYQKIIGCTLLLLSLVISIYFLGESFVKEEGKYGILMNALTAYALASVLMLFFAVITYFAVDLDKQNELLIIGLILLISMILQFALTNILKNIASRPRYRFLIDTDLNSDNVVFQPWYSFNHRSGGYDYFKSFPSGHTATATQCLLLACLTPVLKKQRRFTSAFLFYIGLAYALFIAFFRIFYGAHFLSDVSFGLLLSSTFAFLSAIIGNRFLAKEVE